MPAKLDYYGAFADNVSFSGLPRFAAPGGSIVPTIAAPGLPLTFDEFTGDSGALGNYGGLTWDNIFWARSEFVVESLGVGGGFVNGQVSSPNVGFTGANLPSGSIVGPGGANFTFSSAYLTAAWRTGLSVEVVAFDDGVERYRQTLTLDNDAATLFTFNFRNIDTVTFTGSGGTNVDPAADGSNVVLDDVVVKTPNGAVSGVVFDDVDADGVQDTGELGLRGARVFIDLDQDGVLDTGELSAKANRDGEYTIKNVPFGQYDVMVVVPDGSQATAPYVDNGEYAASSTRYKWVDISDGEGTVIVPTSADDGFGFFELSDAIELYGEEYGDLYISTNGFITFDALGATSFSNAPLPNATAPAGMIAPFWTDLNFTTGGTIYAYEDTAKDRVIVTWDDVPLFGDSSGATNSFQAIIYQNGKIVYQYQDVTNDGSTTTGVESGDGTQGTTITDGVAPADGTAVQLRQGEGTYGVATVIVNAGQTTTDVNFGLSELPSTLSAAAFADHDAGASGRLGATVWCVPSVYAQQLLTGEFAVLV